MTICKAATSPHEFRATVTGRGQVTIPAKVRKVLGVKLHDTVTFRVRGKQVEVSASSSSLDSLLGFAKRGGGPQDLDARVRLAKEDKVAREYGSR